MKRVYVCSVMDFGNNRLDCIQVHEDYLHSFIQICMDSDFRLLIEDILDYDSRK